MLVDRLLGHRETLLAQIPRKPPTDFAFTTSRRVYVHEGAAYRFSNQAHLDAFKQNPDRYAPQYGGFCAYGVAVGKKFDGDPRLWKIADGKLYLNLNEKIYRTFLEDVNGNVRKADGNWTKIEHTAVKDL